MPVSIVAQMLINPVLNLSKSTVSYATYQLFIDCYLNETVNTADMRISPLLATEIQGIPQTIIVVGEKDEIRQDGDEYHQKLLQTGVYSTLFVQPYEGHLGELWYAGHENAKPAINFVVTELNKIFLPSNQDQKFLSFF